MPSNRWTAEELEYIYIHGQLENENQHDLADSMEAKFGKKRSHEAVRIKLCHIRLDRNNKKIFDPATVNHPVPQPKPKPRTTARRPRASRARRTRAVPAPAPSMVPKEEQPSSNPASTNEEIPQPSSSSSGSTTGENTTPPTSISGSAASQNTTPPTSTAPSPASQPDEVLVAAKILLDMIDDSWERDEETKGI